MNRRHFLQSAAIAGAYSYLRAPLKVLAAGHANYAPVLADGIFVSVTGDDTADGSSFSPLRTLSEAVARIKEASLPVELEGVTALVDGLSAILRWTTASETNNAGFSVEQLVEDTWTERAYVTGHGTTAQKQRYEVRLQQLSPGLHHFRLRQVDYDGRAQYSEVVQVTIDAPMDIQVLPNPARDLVRIYGLPEEKSATLYDLAGRRVLRVTSTGAPVTLDVSSFARGQYFLQTPQGVKTLVLL